LHKYRYGADKELSPDKDVALAAIDEAINSAAFWAYMLTLDALYEVIRLLFAWSNSCTCHYDLDWDAAPDEARKRWESCPTRGLRLPEVSAGELFLQLDRLLAQSLATLETSYPDDLSDEDRFRRVADFE
jgi:hypothetical protein